MKVPSSPVQRTQFETWVKSTLPECWPNPAADGTYVDSVGRYHNRTLDHMWLAWCTGRTYLAAEVLT